MKRFFSAIAGAALACVLAAGPVRADRTIRVVFDDGRAEASIRLYSLPSDSGTTFMRAGDIARLLRATEFWNATRRKVVLGVGRTRFVFTVDTRVVVADGDPLMMRAPVRYDGGFVLVPLEFLLEIAPAYTPRTFEWDAGAGMLTVRGTTWNVRGIDVAAAGDRTTVTITLDEPLLYHMDAGTPGLVRLKLYGGRVDPSTFAVRKPRGFVLGARAEQSERDAFVVLDIDPRVRRIRVDRDREPDRLVLTLEAGELPEIPEPEMEGREVVDIVDESAVERRRIDIRRVCIDPGHGGRDTGKVGPDGLLEKDVNLQIARAIGRHLQDDLGLEVVMTREDDRLVPLEKRTEIANASGADLFISVHCNSWFGERAGGFEAYFLAPARSASARALARFENAAGGEAHAGPQGDVEFILWDLVQNEYINESSTFAEFIQREVDRRIGIRSRGVKQANFKVLQGARMPAVLIETAYLSNPDEARLLADPDFHERIAEGIVEAVRRMRDRYR